MRASIISGHGGIMEAIPVKDNTCVMVYVQRVG